jgi:hypothetical protein
VPARVAGALLAGLLLAPAAAPETLFLLPSGITESSGLATSSTSDDWVFTHQDSGDDANVYAIGRTGELLATYDLGVEARDWEDMARGPDEQGRSSLWLADIGDNRAVRERGLLVHRVPEPQVDPAGRKRKAELDPVSFRLVYEDGPRDAETLLVHPRTGRLYVVTKEPLRRPALYAAPARLDPSAPNALRRLGDLELPRTQTAGGPGQGGAVRVLVTAGDVSPDGTRLALRTYTDVVVWPLAGGEVEDALDAEPSSTPLPPTEQGEGLAWTRDGTAVLTTTEGDPAPVHRVPVPVVAQERGPLSSLPLPTAEPGLPWVLVAATGAGVVLVVLLLRRASRRRRRSYSGR